MGNNFRTFFLMGVLTVIFVLVGGQIAGNIGMITAFIGAAAMNVFSYWFSDKLVLKRYNATELGPESNSRLYKIVESLIQEADLPMPKVYIIPGQSPNAFATGKNQ